MSFIRGMAFLRICPLFFFILAIPAFGQSADACLTCHGSSSLAVTKLGRAHSLFVNGAVLKDSVHSSLSCVDCHRGFNPGKIPHADVIGPVQCGTCHEIIGFDDSVHGIPAGADENSRLSVGRFS